VRVGDLVKDFSGGWTGIIIAEATGNPTRLPRSREVKVYFLTHNLSRWMLADRLEVLSEAR
jgi:hypothetical protein